MPYVLQQQTDEQAYYEDVQVIDPTQLHPAAVAAQGAAAVLAASLRALAAQRRSKEPCNKPTQANGLTPCEEKKRMQRLQTLRQRLNHD